MRPSRQADRPEIDRILTESWGEPRVATHDRLYDLTTLPTLVATLEVALANEPGAPGPVEQIVGVLTYHIRGDAIEVVSVDANPQGNGTGTALLTAAGEVGVGKGLARLWLVTTNDNLDAMRFYQRRGLHILAVYPNAVVQARARKPTIPTIGAYGIPIRDEIVLGREL